MDTKAESISVPRGFIMDLDEIIGKYGDYSSRADFVTSAIRYYESTVYLAIARFYKNYDRINEMAGKLNTILDNGAVLKVLVASILCESNLMDYPPEKAQVLVRLPYGLVERINYLVNDMKLFSSRQDFYRRAIEYYLDAHSYRRETFEALKSNNLGALKNILSDEVDMLSWSENR